jgi:AmmeMemoRadiSam system protein A
MDRTISDTDRETVLRAARQAIVDVTAGRRPYEAPATGVFARRTGAFVSLHRGGELRGCIGHIGADQSLGQVISHCAVAAAVEDPRFAPVTAEEVPGLDIEVSVLTEAVRVFDLSEIEVGRDGLIVEHHGHKGLLLPQVATEYGWDREAFLARTCAKAGLPADSWARGAAVYRFQAEVFGESRGAPPGPGAA